jgi:O-acetylhomoserine/O-acetylserine sulfhydrylase-like pyridoxal-dependent enzyme
VTDRSKHPSLATLLVHGGREPLARDESVASPLYQSVNFQHPVGTAEGMRYPRYGNNPTAELVQRRLALLEGAEERRSRR